MYFCNFEEFKLFPKDEIENNVLKGKQKEDVKWYVWKLF